MRSDKSVVGVAVVSFFSGVACVFILMLLTGYGQDIPGTGGLTRYQVAEMLVDCDRGIEGDCVADVNIRPNEVNP